MLEQKSNRVFDTNDTIDFGQMKGEPFKWLYLLCPNYLIWLIEDTDICFANLSLFYQFGEPLKLNTDLFSDVQKEKIYLLTQDNGKKTLNDSYLLTIEIYSQIVEKGIINSNIFEKVSFEFSEKTIEINNRKLESSHINYSGLNVSRNIYLSKLFYH